MKAQSTEPTTDAALLEDTGSGRPNIKPLLRLMAEKKASDLFFTSRAPAKIKEVMSRSNRLGMKTFDQALFDLYESRQISFEEALRNADSKNEVRLRIKLESKREDALQAETASALRIAEEESNEGTIY